MPDIKDNTIRIRLDTNMKQWVYKQAETQDISVSQVIRNLVVSAMSNK